MKYYIAAGFLVMAVIGYSLFSGPHSGMSTAANDAYAGKRDRVENETKERPASFADMKFKEGDADRAPASKK